MAMRLKNTSASPVTGVSAFTLHNFHLGYGRPYTISDLKTTDTTDNGETITFDGAGGKSDFLERAFAGVVVARALAPVSHHGASWSGSPSNVHTIVNNGGSADLPDLNGQAPTADGSVSAYQFNFGILSPGEERWLEGHLAALEWALAEIAPGSAVLKTSARVPGSSAPRRADQRTRTPCAIISQWS